jgi:geranylgeranyl diphosphate synthase type II
MLEQPPPTFELKPYLALQRQIVNTALDGHLDSLPSAFHMRESLVYALSTGGKRVRPILCLASCAAVGGEKEIALPAACALEMIHTYSLIHDDLPALDDDDLRRGKPTCHVQFDEATAILTGDALLNMAFEILSETGRRAGPGNASLWLQVIAIISIASGCLGMIEGQARDLAFEGVKLTQEALESMHRLKTGALIRAAVHAGAILGGAGDAPIERLNRYAENIGLAFQVIDDILNIKGDPSVLGKAVGTDASRQKNTYPALLGLERSRAYADQLIGDALQALDIFDNKADPLRAIAHYIVDRNR